MKVKSVWPECERLNGHWCFKRKIDSLWLECDPDEVREEVLPYIPEIEQQRKLCNCCGEPYYGVFFPDSYRFWIEQGLKSIKQKIKKDKDRQVPELAPCDKTMYFLVSLDMTSIQLLPWQFPIIHGFKQLCPEIEIDSLDEIRNIKLIEKEAEILTPKGLRKSIFYTVEK